MNRLLSIRHTFILATAGTLLLYLSARADNEVANAQSASQPNSLTTFIEEPSPDTSKESGSNSIPQSISELHNDVRLLRRDVHQLIELLQKRETSLESTSSTNAADATIEPPARTFESPSEVPKPWKLSLNEVIFIALQNSKPLRDAGVRVTIDDSSGNAMLAVNNWQATTIEIRAAAEPLVVQVEQSYWNLWEAHRNFEAAQNLRDASHAIWKTVHEKHRGGIEHAEAEAKAEDQYFLARAQIDDALNELKQTEVQLRKRMSLVESDGRMILPTDQPKQSEFKLSWERAHELALANDTQLIAQQELIDQREREFEAAKKVLGDDVYNRLNSSPPFSHEIFSFPIEQLRAFTSVRNLQSSRETEKARLDDMKLNKSHTLTSALQNLDANKALAETHLIRFNTARKELDTVDLLYKGGKVPLDIVLDAQRRRASAEQDYHGILAHSAKERANVDFQIGDLLEERGVILSSPPADDGSTTTSIPPR